MVSRVVFVLGLLLALPGAAAEFWVSPSGNDDNAGTRAKPFASLERARDAARAHKGAHTHSREKTTIWLRGSEYVRTNCLELTAADSGTPKAPVIWRAYKDEPVRLLGGRVLTGLTPVTDTAVLARLDEKARGHVVQLNLRALGITDFGEMKSRGFGRPTATAHCELFYGHLAQALEIVPIKGPEFLRASFFSGHSV